MSFDFNNDKPIYLQIIELIKMQIISNKYSAGDKIPSVRELSMQLSVNPNTIQKALSELEMAGLIITERTNGKFVTDNKELIGEIKMEFINKKVFEFFDDMKKIGLTKQEVIKFLENKNKE